VQYVYKCTSERANSAMQQHVKRVVHLGHFVADAGFN